MNNFWIYLREALGKALQAAEREAVVGDFAELAMTDRQAATSLLGLVMRRQLRGWKEWQPWFALLAIILPVCPLLVMLCTQLGMSVWPSVISWVHHGPSYDTGLSPLAFWSAICLRAGALITWSWTSGFALGTLSRRTLGVSGVVFFSFYLVLANVGHVFRQALLDAGVGLAASFHQSPVCFASCISRDPKFEVGWNKAFPAGWIGIMDDHDKWACAMDESLGSSSDGQLDSRRISVDPDATYSPRDPPQYRND